jgi:cyclopropane-fatty-acyl-phospholipid synthase
MVNHPAVTPFQRFLFNQLRRFIGQAPIRLRLGTGHSFLSDGIGSECIVICDNSALAGMMLDPEIGFGDAYMSGRIEIEGDLVHALEVVLRAMRNSSNRRWFDRLVSSWLHLIQANTLGGSASNIHHHYDLHTDFYKLWLDPQLVYTCAYFPSPSTTLEEAQVSKLDYICRKLQLQPGERVVDAGCGWGALAIYMAKHYGVTVRAYNISHEQIEYAQARARKEGLADQVEFVEDDYRNISGDFDVFVSVGMLEHVGREHYYELEEVIFRTIGNSGRGLLHFIGRNRPAHFSTWIRKRIFPGAYAPALREAVEIFEKHEYSVLDVENLRQHYALTLEHWLQLYERSADRVIELFGPEFFRAWKLYLAGSLASFRIGHLQLFQVAFVGSACQRIPWTRAHLYAEDSQAEEESRWSQAAS